MPLLTQESYDKLATFFSLVGASCRNPVDPGVNRKQLIRIIELIEQDANIDNLVLLMSPPRRWLTPEQLESDIHSVISIKKRKPKPVMSIIHCSSSPEDIRQVNDMAQKLRDGGIPSFTTVERGARALRNSLEYYRFRNSTGRS